MKEAIDLVIAIIVSGGILFGGSYTLKEVHDFVRCKISRSLTT